MSPNENFALYVADLERYYRGDSDVLGADAALALFLSLPPGLQEAANPRRASLAAHWYKVCRNCGELRREHLDGTKCLFEPTEFDPCPT